MTIANESGGDSIETAGTIMSGDSATKILRALKPAAPPEDGAREGILRYDIGNAGDMVTHPSGDWCCHDDHLAEVARLREDRDSHQRDAIKARAELAMSRAILALAVPFVREAVGEHADPDAWCYNECDKNECGWCNAMRQVMAKADAFLVGEGKVK